MIFDLHNKLTPQKNALPPRAYYEIEGAEKIPLADFAFAYSPRGAEELTAIEPKTRERVPFCWQMRGYDAHQYTNVKYPFPYDPPHILKENPAGVYVTKISVPVRRGRFYLCFEGVDSCFYLFVNGTFAGYSSVSHSGAEFDVTNLLRAENEVRIVVFKWNAGSYLEDQDKFRMSGIFREVYLLNRPEGHLRDFTVRTDVEEGRGIVEVSLDRPARITLSRRGEELFSAYGKHARIEVASPALWNAEEPNLYDLTLFRKGEKICEKVGIRKVERRGNLFLVNGKKVKLKGVNRHGFTSAGFAETAEDLRRDLLMMKACNMNAIRTSHYPPHPVLPRLCDELGFYLLEEADIECHGVTTQTGNFRADLFDSLASDPRYKEQFENRVLRMYERDKNRPSVIIWSLGNESGWGENFVRAARLLKRKDGTRPIHYEGTWDIAKKKYKRENVLDFYSRMYPDTAWLDAFAKTSARPVILCEYTHAMGNSCGDVKDYWKVIRAHDSICGAFVWEWNSESVKIGKKICYGGDFGDYPNGGNFCMDGLVTCERVPNPSYFEVKEAYAPADVFREGEDYTVLNLQDFCDLSGFVCRYEFSADGVPFSRGELPIGDIPAGGEKRFTLPTPERSGYLAVTFSFLRGGERAAVRQFVLREEYVSRKMLRAAGEGEELPPFELFLDRERIDNDVNISREWDRYELSRARERILSEKREGGTRTTERVFAADSVRPIARATVKEEALGGGAFRVSAHITVEKDLWSVPRIGFRFALPRDFHTVSWYGRGPGEAYCDRHAASPVGFYRGDVRTMNYRYPKPQESGSRCGTRFVALSDGVRGLLFDAAEDFSFQATEYDARQTPAHDCERRRSGKVFLHLDKKMAGVGSNACGPGLKEEYCVREKELDLTFCVKPFREGEDLFALHRTVFGR